MFVLRHVELWRLKGKRRSRITTMKSSAASGSLTDLSVANIESAASVIDPVFRNSPQFADDQLCEALGRRVIVKVETANPIRSFKGRGADFLMGNLDKRQKVVCASAGNFGQAMAYAGRSRGIDVEVFASVDVNPVKASRMRALGATVTLAGKDFEDAKEQARACAQREGHLFVEDGKEAAICEGAGTIAVELLNAYRLDAIVVPVGDGALITGIAAWTRHRSRTTKIVGVCAKGAPAMVDSWRLGKSISGIATSTIADGIAVRSPIPESVERVKKLVDDIVMVDDAQMLEAMRLAARTLGLMLEPAGAAGLAAIRNYPIPGQQIATVLTGSNILPDLMASCFSGS
jgi:threonine dehydratase